AYHDESTRQSVFHVPTSDQYVKQHSTIDLQSADLQKPAASHAESVSRSVSDVPTNNLHVKPHSTLNYESVRQSDSDAPTNNLRVKQHSTLDSHAPDRYNPTRQRDIDEPERRSPYHCEENRKMTKPTV